MKSFLKIIFGIFQLQQIQCGLERMILFLLTLIDRELQKMSILNFSHSKRGKWSHYKTMEIGGKKMLDMQIQKLLVELIEICIVENHQENYSMIVLLIFQLSQPNTFGSKYLRRNCTRKNWLTNWKNGEYFMDSFPLYLLLLRLESTCMCSMLVAVVGLWND